MHPLFVQVTFKSNNEDLLHHFFKIGGLIFNELVRKELEMPAQALSEVIMSLKKLQNELVPKKRPVVSSTEKVFSRCGREKLLARYIYQLKL